MSRTRVKSTSVQETQQKFASGRSVIVKVVDQREQLEVRSPQGEVEVRILFDESGPIVQLRGARLELEAAKEVAVKCERFEVEAAESMALRSAGDISLAGKELKADVREDIHLDGELIRLNCQDRSGRKNQHR